MGSLRGLLAEARFRRRLASATVATVFATASIYRALDIHRNDGVWLDLHIYRDAATAMLSGGDPWAVSVKGFAFAGTPPALLAYVPATFMPVSVAIALYAVAFAVAWLAAVRALRLPAYWIVFPPVVDAFFALNPDTFIVTLLLIAGPGAGLAIVLKSYAAIPLALQGRWRAVAVGLAISIVPFPLWIQYLQRAPELTSVLQEQARGGLSAWGTWLIIPCTLALVALRGRGASWLVVPALWPFTQFHYSAIAVPYARRSPVVAILLSFPLPFLPAIAVILEAVRLTLSAAVAGRSRSRDSEV